MKPIVFALALAVLLSVSGCILEPGGEGNGTFEATAPETKPSNEVSTESPAPQETEPATDEPTASPETTEFGFSPETDRTPIY